MPTRCKFTCQSVTKRAAWNKPGEFVHEAEFSAVHEDSPENKAFFDATPSGTLRIGTYKPDIFTPGKQYYLDVSEAA
jgi:hypothetical protein